MATITKTQTVCDVCLSPRRRVRTYLMDRDGDGTLEYVLCATCGRPVDEIIDRVEGVRPHRASRKVKIYTLEEIEARKKEAAPPGATSSAAQREER